MQTLAHTVAERHNVASPGVLMLMDYPALYLIISKVPDSQITGSMVAIIKHNLSKLMAAEEPSSTKVRQRLKVKWYPEEKQFRAAEGN